VTTCTSDKLAREQESATLPSIRIGVAAGLTGLLCCLGPTVLALLSAQAWWSLRRCPRTRPFTP
jgi:hypothetical protein